MKKSPPSRHAYNMEEMNEKMPYEKAQMQVIEVQKEMMIMTTPISLD